MLSKTRLEKRRIEFVCAMSGEIRPGDIFRGCKVSGDKGFVSIPADREVVCCGAIAENELLLRTRDGRYYFSILDGWGTESGTLFGMRPGFCYDFGRPTREEGVLSGEVQFFGRAPRSWSEAMAYRARRDAYNKMVAALRTNGV